jgi:hypothetical protein
VAILSGIIINKNLKLLLINYLARKVDVLFHFPSRSQYTWDRTYGRTVYLVGANLCSGTLTEFFAVFLVPPRKFRCSASKSYDLFFPCYSNPSSTNKPNIGVAYLKVMTAL